VDFEPTEAQAVIASSAADVLAGASDPAGAWSELAKAGLLALNLPGWLGGDDLGVLDAATLLTEVGRRAAFLPALATIMLGVLPVTRWGSRELQERVLAGVGRGDVLLTAAVREQSTVWPAEPATVADRAGQGVTGAKVGVPYADQASWLLVPATLPAGGTAVAVVARAGPGVTVTATPASGRDPQYSVRLDAAPVVGLLGDDSVAGLYRLAAAGAVAQADGALAGALELTAGYVAKREQFGRPLATFQAVAQQIADVYVAARTLHLAALSACWRLTAGLDADEDLGVAGYWLAAEAPQALRTCHHLHGGIGVDVEYPLHRYSSMITDLVSFVGGADYQLEMLARRGC
jgi:alkylation response protein AidB-like acyl-CoA dehydrogenase